MTSNEEDSKGLKRKVLNLLNFADFFGQPIFFTINGKRTSKTIFGGICSVAMGLLIISFGIYISRDLFMHLDPTISRFDYLFRDYIHIKVKETKLSMAVELEGQDSTGFFDIKVDYISYDSSTGEFKSRLPIPLVECTKDHWPLIDDDQFKKALRGKKCLSFDDIEEDVDIYGAFSEKNIGFMFISLQACEEDFPEDTEGYESRCKSKEEIESKLDNGNYFTLSMLSCVIDPYNYTYPMKYYVNNAYILPSKQHSSITSIYLKEESLETDDGPIIKNHKVNVGYTIHKEMSFVTHFNEFNDGIFATFEIYASNSQTKTKRIYKRVQEILASIGGIVSIILNFVPYVCLIFSQTKKDEYVLNKLIDFDIKKTKNVPNKRFSSLRSKGIELGEVELARKSRALTFNQTKSEVSSFSSNMTESKANEMDRKINAFLYQWEKKKASRLKFSFCQVIKLWICPCCKSDHNFNHKKMLYEKALTIVDDYFEITYLIGKLDELEKLKFVVMNNKQLSLFRFISSDICSMDERKMKNHPMRRNKLTFNDEKKMAQEVFLYKKELETNLDLIKGMDLRLIELLSTKLDLV